MKYRSPGAALLAEAATSIGLDIVAPPALDSDADLGIRLPPNEILPIQVKQMSIVSGDAVPAWLARDSAAVLPVVVADRVTSAGRSMLTQARWGWLDLRGHLRLVGPGLFVDTEVPALRVAAGRKGPWTGITGIEIAVALLLEPERSVSVRGLARQLHRSPSTVSETLTALRDAELVDREARPVLPVLFWELAEHWKPERVDVATNPGPGSDAEALGYGLDEEAGSVGWALTDTVAAAAYGAPVAVQSGYPRTFYVPDRNILRRSVRLLGAPAVHAQRAATVQVAPVAAACAERRVLDHMANMEWPVTRPLFVALDLAQDPARGREILDGWTPKEPDRRVW